MWELDCEESWALKNWCFWTVVLEKALESPLDCKEIQSVHSKEDQSWVFFGRTDAKAETPVLWPPDAKSWLIWKDPDAGRDWGQEKGMTEDEMARWHHWLNGHESEWTPGVGDEQGGLACCNSCGCLELDTTEWLNWMTLLIFYCKQTVLLWLLNSIPCIWAKIGGWIEFKALGALLLPGRMFWFLLITLALEVLFHSDPQRGTISPRKAG